MVAVTVFLAAAALLIWPAVPARRVLAERCPAPGSTGLARWQVVLAGGAPTAGRGRSVVAFGLGGLRWPRLLPIAVSTLVAVAGTWPCAVAAGIATGTGSALIRHAAARRRSRRQVADVAAALRALARELRAGTEPAGAIDAIVRSAPAWLATMLSSLPAAADHRGSAEHRATAEHRTSAEHCAAIDRRAARSNSSEVLDSELLGAQRRLVAGWELSLRHGIPLVSVVGAIADDLADRERAARVRAAQVAGPAVSGYVLAALPAAGLLLGIGMGADPVAVFTGSPLGGALLVAGTLLCCVGLLWTERMVQ